MDIIKYFFNECLKKTKHIQLKEIKIDKFAQFTKTETKNGNIVYNWFKCKDYDYEDLQNKKNELMKLTDNLDEMTDSEKTQFQGILDRTLQELMDYCVVHNEKLGRQYTEYKCAFNKIPKLVEDDSILNF